MYDNITPYIKICKQIYIYFLNKNTMTEAEKKVESSAPEAQANSSESWWDKFTGKNATEAAKKKMEDILTLQKTELAHVISEFKQGKTDIVGKSNQQKMELLAEVSKTINNLKNNRNINGIVNDNLSVTEDAYEKLEAKITGTKEVVDFKHPEFIEMAIANLEQFKQELSGASIESTQAEAGDVKESVHLSYGSNNNPSVSSNLYGNTSDDISQKLIDVKIANQEKKNKVDEFKTKSLDEIKQLNDEYITTYTESLKDKLNGATDAEMKKKIERLISSYMSVQELIKSTRTSSENSSESQKKEQEISIYENNLYALNKKTEQLLGTETIEKTIEEPIPAIITPVTSAPAVTVESIPDETLPPKDFYEHINFSKKKKDWPAKERELAIESIKKEVNSNDELADALSKLEYSSK